MTRKNYATALSRLNRDTDGNIYLPLRPLELAVMTFTSGAPNQEKLAQLKALAPYINDEQKEIKKIIKGIKAMIKLEEKIRPVGSNVNALIDIAAINQFVADFNGALIDGHQPHTADVAPDILNVDIFGNLNDEIFLIDDEEDVDTDAENNDELFEFDDDEDDFPDSQNPFIPLGYSYL